ncbi:CopG family transcriptional regulator/antitoxin EndoAI [Salsuginibacillus halophilus]|uniref:CopG family transcriptional regulator/antitoxin EndoAI n=1 Tax=Salsuginibacillus halophilus TaxID=517424 RepID=A0A2P8H8G5_9BACI|nr:CopG family transcriptional regulator/antitoxin EndoAI [Salsuginibacillus halophilus]
MAHDRVTEIKVNLPEELLREMDGIIYEYNLNRDDFICQAAETYLHEREKTELQTLMQQGYMEMANINLNIAAESFVAEEEAGSTLNHRLVSGV